MKQLLFGLFVGCIISISFEHLLPVKYNKITVIGDYKNGMVKLDKDSIWWIREKFVEESRHGIFVYGHNVPSDTLIGIKNFNPFVVCIYNNTDTERHYIGDTLRFTYCNSSQYFEPKIISDTIGYFKPMKK